ncbi:unnamed protein product, partial [Closterium sp. Yama58-4]
EPLEHGRWAAHRYVSCSTGSGGTRAAVSECGSAPARVTCSGREEWGPDWHVDKDTKWPFSSAIFSLGIFKAFVRTGLTLGVWKTRQITFALFALENPILSKTAEGKLSSKPGVNRSQSQGADNGWSMQ